MCEEEYREIFAESGYLDVSQCVASSSANSPLSFLKVVHVDFHISMVLCIWRRILQDMSVCIGLNGDLLTVSPSSFLSTFQLACTTYDADETSQRLFW